MSGGGRAERIAAVVGEVLRQAMADSGAGGIVLLDDGGAEASLAAAWAMAALGESRVMRASGTEMASRVRSAQDPATAGPTADSEVVEEEARRLEARLQAAARGWLCAHPINKTALLLADRAPPEPLLPLGDVWASQVAELAGDWSAPRSVRALVEAAGGVDALDAALIAHFDERRDLSCVLERLPERVRGALRDTLERARFARRRVGLVPKLGSRTAGIDLFG